MKTIIMEPDFSKVKQMSLVIGVPEHPENTEGWDGFVRFFQSTFTGMVKVRGY